MADKPHNNLSSLPVFGSPEWHQKNAEEVAGRPVTNKVRKPITAEEFESYRPKE